VTGGGAASAGTGFAGASAAGARGGRASTGALTPADDVVVRRRHGGGGPRSSSAEPPGAAKDRDGAGARGASKVNGAGPGVGPSSGIRGSTGPTGVGSSGPVVQERRRVRNSVKPAVPLTSNRRTSGGASVASTHGSDGDSVGTGARASVVLDPGAQVCEALVDRGLTGSVVAVCPRHTHTPRPTPPRSTPAPPPPRGLATLLRCVGGVAFIFDSWLCHQAVVDAYLASSQQGAGSQEGPDGPGSVDSSDPVALYSDLRDMVDGVVQSSGDGGLDAYRRDVHMQQQIALLSRELSTSKLDLNDSMRQLAVRQSPWNWYPCVLPLGWPTPLAAKVLPFANHSPRSPPPPCQCAQGLRDTLSERSSKVQQLVQKVNALTGTVSGLLQVLNGGAETPSATSQAVLQITEAALVQVRSVGAVYALGPHVW
jgi:hypothetical protein